MKRTRFLVLSLILASMIIPSLISGASATTQEEAFSAGAGFHEPSNDWYDESYKYRIPINVTASGDRDENVTTFDIDFADYFSEGSGIVDTASMQLVHYAANESSIPIDFQAKTDSVDIWNAPTLQEIEDVILGTLISENATFIGTVFNSYEGSGVMNQSIRFQTYLREPRSTILFQFIYDAPRSIGVGTSDYLQVYAGVPGNWGSPIRIYKSMLPTEKRWTKYFAVPLEETMSGKVWIVMEAPTLQKGSQIKFFSLDFSFLDGNGFDRNVEHFLPELDIPGKTIRQDNYYPRVQVLENEGLASCTISFKNLKESTSLSRYYLYFNFMNESNGRIINNNVVKFTGELSIPQTYFRLNMNNQTFIIDKDEVGPEGGMSVIQADQLVETLMQVLGMSGSASGYDVENVFGTVYSQAIFQTDEITVTMTLYDGCDFIEVLIVQDASISVYNYINHTASDRPLVLVGNETEFVDVTDFGSGTFEGDSSRMILLNPDNETYLAVLFNTSIEYQVNVDMVDEEHEIYFSATNGLLATIHPLVARELYSVDSGVSVLEDTESLQDKLDTRITVPMVVTLGDREEFSDPEIFVLDAKTGFLTYHVVGDRISIALFGNNLQSITVEISGFINETATNGTFTIPSISHGLFDASYKFIFRGRNEFGSVVSKELTIVVADNTLDIFRVLVISLFLPIIGIGATALTIVTIAAKNRSKKKAHPDCVMGEDGKCLLDG